MNFWGGPSIESFGRHRVSSVAGLYRIALNHDAHLVLTILGNWAGVMNMTPPVSAMPLIGLAHVTRVINLVTGVAIVQDHLALVARRRLVVALAMFGPGPAASATDSVLPMLHPWK
jgi:hypothetical protein